MFRYEIGSKQYTQEEIIGGLSNCNEDHCRKAEEVGDDSFFTNLRI